MHKLPEFYSFVLVYVAWMAWAFRISSCLFHFWLIFTLWLLRCTGTLRLIRFLNKRVLINLLFFLLLRLFRRIWHLMLFYMLIQPRVYNCILWDFWRNRWFFIFRSTIWLILGKSWTLRSVLYHFRVNINFSLFFKILQWKSVSLIIWKFRFILFCIVR